MPRFDKVKCKYPESFERFTMPVAQVVNCGKKFNDSLAVPVNVSGSGYQLRWKLKFMRR